MRKSISLLLFILSISLTGFAQRSVTGSVTDEDGKPLQGVNVVLKETNAKTITTNDGKFTLNASAKDKTIVFSYVGMITREVVMNGKLVFNIQLVSSAPSLEDVVVIGYGTVKKKDLTGSVSVVKSAELEQSQSTGFLQALQG
jgi:hypothetical protein